MNHARHSLRWLLLPALLTACDPAGSPAEDAALSVAAEQEAAPRVAGAPPAPPSAKKHAEHEGHGGPGPVMPEAKMAFEELATLVEAKYVDGPISEDELWTGAMEGVLARLVQLPGHEINKLLPPRDHEELLIGTKGRLVGVGIMIERVADVVVVRGVIPDGPAQGAGLQAGDRILGIDGVRIKELELVDVVERIRGEEGSTVDLFVQRDTEEWTETITRGLVTVASVESTVLPGGVGYMRITSFSQNTVAELDAQLAALSSEGADRLVLDLRRCPGGLLEASLEAASRFVPPGKTLLTIEGRKQTDERKSEGEYPWQGRPLTVLIGPHTASGAEILADAISEHGQALLLGEATLGKHTIESIHELSGGWAVKLSVSRFGSASGETRQGVGVRPDIQIPGPDELEHRPLSELDPAADPVLSAAIELLRAG